MKTEDFVEFAMTEYEDGASVEDILERLNVDLEDVFRVVYNGGLIDPRDLEGYLLEDIEVDDDY